MTRRSLHAGMYECEMSTTEEVGAGGGVTLRSEHPTLFGCAFFAGLTAVLGPPLRIVTSSALDPRAGALLGHPWWVALLSAVVAGWLMGLTAWLVTASPSTRTDRHSLFGW